MGTVAHTYTTTHLHTYTPSLWETEMEERCKLGVSLDYVRVVG